MRDDTFSNLTDGTHGLAVSGGEWVFSGSSDTTGIFTRDVAITTIDASRKGITATIFWQQTPQRTGQVTLESRVTNWRALGGVPLCADQSAALSVDISGVSLGAGGRLLQDIFVENTDTTCDINISSITASWSDPSAHITRVQLGGTTVWTGDEPTGTNLDITDSLLAEADGPKETTYRYDTKMTGETFTLTFIMDDGTSQTIPGITP
jgi:hypothetical protein